MFYWHLTYRHGNGFVGIKMLPHSHPLTEERVLRYVFRHIVRGPGLAIKAKVLFSICHNKNLYEQKTKKIQGSKTKNHHKKITTKNHHKKSPQKSEGSKTKKSKNQKSKKLKKSKVLFSICHNKKKIYEKKTKITTGQICQRDIVFFSKTIIFYKLLVLKSVFIVDTVLKWYQLHK